MRKLIVGSRKSDLAVTQSNWVIDQLLTKHPQLTFDMEKIVTKGDRILDVTLSKVGGKGLFIKEIEQALHDKRIDFAVHSMKDLPGEIPDGLVIAAVPERESPFDCMISETGVHLDQLPAKSVVGTSSLRRQSQILSIRPDLRVKPIRGNINTRLNKLSNEDFDAIVLAVSGLARMGWEEKMTQELSTKEMIPAVGQGALAIQCREEDQELIEWLQAIHHEETARLVQAERAFLYAFEGGCHLPIAGFAEKSQEGICLNGLVADPDGKQIIKERLCGQDPEKLGKSLAEKLIQRGAKGLLATV